MITKTIGQQIAEAMKARDEVRLSTLKMLSSALNYEFIEKQHELSDEEELAVVRKEAKKRREAIEAYKNAGAIDRSEKEGKELEILQEFLPPEMSDQELAKIVDEAFTETGATSIADMGKVMGAVMAKSGGRADGAKVAAMVKEKLQ